MKDKLLTFFVMVCLFGLIFFMLIGIPYQVWKDHQTKEQYEMDSSHMQCKEYLMKSHDGFDTDWQKVVSCERK